MPGLGTDAEKNGATTGSADVVSRIAAFNATRDRRLLGLKFKTMAGDSFAFYRATAHLYYEHLRSLDLPASPLGWMTGDLHIENFGVYRAENDLVYFDQNDFDEGLLGAAGPEIVRLLASVAVGSATLSARRRASLVEATAVAYGQALAAGKALWCERATTTGAIRDLLETARKRSRREFLDKRSMVSGRRRHFIEDQSRFLLLNEDNDQYETITEVMRHLGRSQGAPDFYKVRDIKVRVAGLGSLGLPRYAILLRGKGDPDDNTILDMKLAAPSTARSVSPAPQPAFADEATRVVRIMDMAQTFSPRRLTTARMGERSFIVRRLQPQEDKLAYASIDDERQEIFETLGQIAAWAHLRSSGRSGSASADAWIAYGAALDVGPLIDAAERIVEANKADHQAFSKAWKEHDPRIRPPPSRPLSMA